MFEGDQDLDLEGDIQAEIQKKLKAKGVDLEDKHMWDLFNNLEEPNYRPAPSCITSQELCGHINSMSEELFQHYRANPDGYYGQYATVMLAAVMMKTGSKISEDNRNFLRQTAGGTHSSPGYALPLFDTGFRDPGKVQFLAALDNYEEGKPRDFGLPRYVRNYLNLSMSVEADVRSAASAAEKPTLTLHLPPSRNVPTVKMLGTATETARRRTGRITNPCAVHHQWHQEEASG
jgi:hypothetical protein